MTTSPEAPREAVERATANLANTAWTPRRSHYESMRNQLAAAEAALQEAREALGPFYAAWLRHDPSKPYSTAPYLFTTNDTFRRAAEVYRALSPGGAAHD